MQYSATRSSKSHKRIGFEIEISDIKVVVFEQLLNFIYTGNVEIEYALALEILDAADKVGKWNLELLLNLSTLFFP